MIGLQDMQRITEALDAFFEFWNIAGIAQPREGAECGCFKGIKAVDFVRPIFDWLGSGTIGSKRSGLAANAAVTL